MQKVRSIVQGCAIALVAMSASRVSAEPSTAAVDALGTAALANKLAPGFSIAVVHDGAVVYQRGFGIASESGASATAKTRYAVGSLTKQFTAASVLLLVHDGRLTLDDTLSRYFPRFPNASAITLRELLHQTSGLHNYPNAQEHAWPLQGDIEPPRLFAIMQTDKSDFPAGSKWEYSNTNYALLAGVVAKVSGMPYGRFLQTRIFTPLQMASSANGEAAAAAGIAQATWQEAWVKPSDRISLDLFYGAGSLVSTAFDLARWNAGLLRGNVLDSASLVELWSEGKLSDGSPTGYAMGFVPATLDGHRELWHNGLTPTAGGLCYSAIFPDDGVAITILTNSGSAAIQPQLEAMVRQILDLFVAPPKANASAQPPIEDAEVTARVKALYASYMSGKVDTSQMTPKFASLFTAGFIAQLQDGTQSAGAPSSWTFVRAVLDQGLTRYEYAIVLPNLGAKTFVVWIDAAGKIAGSRLR